MTLPDPAVWPVGLDGLLGSKSADLLRRRARTSPDHDALVAAGTDERITYAAFDEAVDALATTLAAHEASRRRVALFLHSRWAFARTYFAVVRTGAAVVPLNTQLPNERVAEQLSRASADLLVCESQTETRARALAPSDVRVTSVADLDHAESNDHRLGAAEVDRPERREGDPTSDSPAATQLVMFTSGTSGPPKGVRLTRRNLVASAVGSAARLGVDPDDRWLVPLPMYHMGGLAPLVRSTLYGTTTVLGGEFDAGDTAREMAQYAVTGVSLVPTMLTRLLDNGWTPTDELRFVLLGGAPASRDLVRRAIDRCVPVYSTYGTTETASQIATATPTEAREQPGTVGRPLSVTEVSVRDGQGSSLEPGERGEVVVDGPTVTPGYLDDALTEKAFGPAGFHTGDVGYRDDAGRLWVVGRLDDRIVSGGENVHPDRVADALCAHDAVEDAAVVGLPDEEWGERVGALVVPAEAWSGGQGPPTPRELVAATSDRLADFAMPKTVAFAESLPRTASGTVDRDAVRNRLRDDTES